MNPNEFNKLEEYQKEVARLQKGLEKFNGKLLALPGKFGFKTMDEFIEALKAAGEARSTSSGSRKARSTSSGPRKVSHAVGQGAKAKRKRGKITQEVKEKVKVMVKEEKTGAEIAKQLGISLPSVQNIKKELGLVKKRGK